jgi:hypothetical protein
MLAHGQPHFALTSRNLFGVNAILKAKGAAEFRPRIPSSLIKCEARQVQGDVPANSRLSHARACVHLPSTVLTDTPRCSAIAGTLARGGGIFLPRDGARHKSVGTTLESDALWMTCFGIASSRGFLAG